MGGALLRTRALAAAWALLAGAAAAQTAAPPVVRVVVRSEAPVDMAEVEPLLAVRTGQPLDEEKVRRTLRSLRLAGLAAEVEMFERPVVGGVEAVIVMRPDVRVDAVAIEGATGLEAARLRPALEQRAGQPLREDRVLRGVYALETALAAEGWLEARARVDVRVDEATRRARLVYRVEAGAPTHVGAVRFEGLGDRVAERDALAALRARPGEVFRRATVRDDADRLQRLLIRLGFRRATVEAAAESPRPEAHAVDLAWKATLGPRVEFELVGAERKQLEKRGLLPFLGDAGYDDALLVQAVDEIRSFFQERGHYDVQVTTAEESSAETLRVRMTVVPGERTTLESIAFEGNQAFPGDRLARLMKTSPRRLLSPGSGRLVDAELNEDLANLRSFYALSGYDRARVGPAQVTRRGSALELTVPIVEGTKRSVAEVRIDGLAALDAGSVADRLPLAAGGPFHRLLLESSVDRIRSLLEEQGYRSAIVSPAVEWNSDSTVARVTFRVLEGERSSADAILVRGNTRTSTPVLRRFLGLHTGDAISTGSLLEVQRRLYRLGVFSSVSVSVPPAGAGPAEHEVLVEVEEGRTRGVAYGAGYDSESGARGLLRLSESNLGGRLITVQLDAIVSQKDERYRLLARQPYLGRWPIETRVLAYREAEDRPQFDVRRRGLQLGLERTFGSLRLGLYYDYRIVELDTAEPVEVVPRESRDARVGSVTPNLLWDRRDDPIDPTRGWSALVQLERAFPLFAADADFGKLFGQVTAYLPLRRAGVVAMSLRAGGIRPFAAPLDPTLGRIDAVPAAELFYAGGLTSHRAYSRDTLGIPGETLFVRAGKDPIPLGGGGLALVNLEWRFPVAGPFGGSLFVDGGNVWRETRDFDPAQARWGVGVGLRYLSPIGPLRVEIGWKLDREVYEDAYVLSFSLGNPF